MPGAFDALWGNERQKSFFSSQIENRSLAHAYVLEGEEGSGKRTLAKAVAAALAPLEDRDKILRGLCPDVKTFGVPAEKKFFPVETVRTLRSQAAVKPSELSFKFYILENADSMNTQAQNAALKLLEEPPEATYFFLLCQSAAALLPTVRSRAPVIRMQRFSPEEVEAYLRRNAQTAAIAQTDGDALSYAVKNCRGSLGKAVELLRKRQNDDARQKAAELISLLARPQKAALLAYVYTLPGKRQETDEILSYACEALRDLLLVRYEENDRALLFFPTSGEAEEASGTLTRAAMIALYEKIAQAREALQKNVNMQNLRMALCAGLYEAAIR